MLHFSNLSDIFATFKVGKVAYILQVLIIAIAYFVTGKLGTYLAIPPGYATAIWPPSGIALAGVLLFGFRAWPGIVLGSVLVNLSTSFAGGTSSEAALSFIVTLIISAGAALQAVVGAYLLKRFAAFPNQLTDEKEIFSFMLFGGIVSALINSSIAVTTLVSVGRVPLSNAFANWGTWWVGDAVGILVFAPLILAWMARPTELWYGRRLVISSSILIAFALTAALANYSSRNEAEYLQLEFDKDSAKLSEALEKNILLHLNELRSIESFYSASSSVERHEFKVFTEDALTRWPGIQALSWNPYIQHLDRAAFENSMYQQLGSDFYITERDDSKQLVRAAERNKYVPIGFIEPLDGNERALGFDVFSNPIRRAAIEQARDTGEVAATARINLVQEQGRQFGVLAFMPIYEKGISINSLVDRRRYIEGFAVAVFRGGDIVSAALKGVNHNQLAYRLIDKSADEGEQLLFASGSEDIPVGESGGLLDEMLMFDYKATIMVGGRQWQFEVIPTQEYIAAYRTNNTWFILLTGFLLTSLVSAIALVSSGRRNLLTKLVAERTLELEESYGHLHKLAHQIPGVIYQFKLSTDGQYSFPYASEGIRDIYEVTPEQVYDDANEVFNVLHPDDYDEIVASIQESAQNMTPWELEYRVNLPRQKIQWLHGQAQPERLNDGSILWHGFISNITEQKNAEAIFHGVFDQSSFLAGMLDHQGKLINVNDAAMSFISERREDVIGQYFPNTPWWNNTDNHTQLIEALESAYAGNHASFETRNSTSDDNFINVLFSATPIILESGTYVSVTGVDITQRKFIEARLRMLSTAIEQGPTSVAITDLDANFEYANSRFTEVTGYKSEEVMGKNTRLLQSGLTDESVYTDMWEKLTNGERWVGELINKRKNGEVYYEEAYISPVKDDDGSVGHYVAVKLDITERKEMEELVRQLAYYDSLTQLPNRRLLSDRLNQAMSVNERISSYGALMFLDLDNFKPLNDTYGHAIGDLLLIEAATRLESCMRKMDTVARFGGDEFVVMLPKLDEDKVISQSQAENVAEKIRLSLSAPYFLKTQEDDVSGSKVEHHCTVSIGIALFWGHDAIQDDVMKWADAAMYLAKEAGRNQIKFYENNEH